MNEIIELKINRRYHRCVRNDGDEMPLRLTNTIPPTVDQSGKRVFYTIMFSLDRVTGLPVQLHMRIKTAYPAEKAPVTYGDVRFRHLVALRMRGGRVPAVSWARTDACHGWGKQPQGEKEIGPFGPMRRSLR